MTPKKVTVTKETALALSQGARLMVFKIDDNIAVAGNEKALKEYPPSRVKAMEYMKEFLPFKQGDEIYIEHDIKICDECCERMDEEYQDCTCNGTGGKVITIKCNERQSRLRFTVGEVGVKRVEDVTFIEFEKLMNIERTFQEWMKNKSKVLMWLKAQDIEPTDYIGLAQLIEEE